MVYLERMTFRIMQMMITAPAAASAMAPSASDPPLTQVVPLIEQYLIMPVLLDR
jgi:hypothetical protein